MFALLLGLGPASLAEAAFHPVPPSWVYIGGGCWGLLVGFEVNDPPYTDENPPHRSPVYEAYECE